jgi:hypothetical protein
MIPKSGNRFPVCAKPMRTGRDVRLIALAGEGRSRKIMLKQKAKAKSEFDLESFRFSVMLAHCRAVCTAYLAAADRRVRDRRVFDGA